MRGLAWGIFAAFAALTAFSIFFAVRMYDGVVERDYYGKSVDFFRNGMHGELQTVPMAAVAEGQKVLLDIFPKPPRAMRELTFHVSMPGYAGPGSPSIDLSMDGMSMAPNRVALEKEGEGRYAGKGILVRCPSGMRKWTATVNLPGKGKAIFRFHVTD